ncbi:hypothetical protein BCR42DRAFT_487120 [Absidia repens]|uniref:SNF2 family N-terminal domain-domain-containing protein n=1 Tax=Absidia repens TaxID=90262 RepID=A0A1X2IVL9_9FUNG|nr:hypothetical protein BCR42DRAFT_487120 [Absidia repens]
MDTSFVKAKLTLKEKILLDKKDLRPLKAIVIPKTTITRIDAALKANTASDAIYGPDYRNGLDSILSKLISNTGSLLYTVKWKDGSTTTVAPNSLRPHYYSIVEAFEYAQFQEDESATNSSSIETEDILHPSTGRRTRSMGMTKRLRSSGIPPSKDMIDSDDALITEDLADDSSHSEDISIRRRLKKRNVRDQSLGDALSVEPESKTRHQPQRQSTTQRAIYNTENFLLSDAEFDELSSAKPPSKKARSDLSTKRTLPLALKKLKKPTSLQMTPISASLRNRHTDICCACHNDGEKLSADGGMVDLADTNLLLPCRYCTNSTHPACCKLNGAFKRIVYNSNKDKSSVSPAPALHDMATTPETTMITPDTTGTPDTTVVDENLIVKDTVTLEERQHSNYHICRKCVNKTSKPDSLKLGDCEKCRKQFVPTETNDDGCLLLRCKNCGRALCTDCIPRSWKEKNGNRDNDENIDDDTASIDQKAIRRSWIKHLCSTCDHFRGRKVEHILTWRRADTEHEPTHTSLPTLNATDLDRYDKDDLPPPSPLDDITNHVALDPSTATNQYVFLVKWEGFSYRHLDWVPASWLDGVTVKYQNFLQKYAGQQPGLMDDVVPLSFKSIDRILDVEKTGSGRIKKVYAKFHGRPYDEVCWDTPPFEPELKAPYLEALRYYHMIDKINSPTNMTKRIEKARSKLRPVDFGKFREFKTQPSYVANGTLLPHQLDGLNWFQYQWERKQPCILADDMGLGKTIQVVTFLDVLFNKYNVYPFLIVVPNSTATNWIREFNKWAPDLVVAPYFGSKKGRALAKKHEIFRHGRGENQISCHVVVMTYESALSDLGEFSGVKLWPYIVVDEAQRLKNNESLLFNRLSQIKTDNRILMTGTPLQNNMGELINIMNFVDPPNFNDTHDITNYYSDLNHQTVQELHRKLKPYFLRRTKDIVLKDLPPKKELIVPLSMTRLQKELYKDYLMKGSKIMAQLLQTQSKGGEHVDNGGKPGKQNYNNILMSLRKILNHPYLIHGVEVIQKNAADTQQAMVDACGKLKLLHMLLPKLFVHGHRVLIFSTMAIALDVLEDYLVGAGVKLVRVDGSTSQVDRVTCIDKFNAADSDVNVFLLTTRAGGVGINLATADTVIIYDSDFNPHADLQAISRAHRFGQKKPVLILRLMTRLSVEERILEKSKKKMVLDHLVVDKMDDEDLESEDVESILKFGLKALFDEDNDAETNITYKAADVDNLLDREAIFSTDTGPSEEIDAIDEKKDEPGIGNMSFSFAKIWQTGERAGTATNNDGSNEKAEGNNEQQDQDIWEKLLEENQRIAENESRHAAENLGRGARKRKAVSYAEIKSRKEGPSKGSTGNNKNGDTNEIDLDLAIDNEDNSDEEFNQPEKDEDYEDGKVDKYGKNGLPKVTSNDITSTSVDPRHTSQTSNPLLPHQRQANGAYSSQLSPSQMPTPRPILIEHAPVYLHNPVHPHVLHQQYYAPPPHPHSSMQRELASSSPPYQTNAPQSQSRPQPQPQPQLSQPLPAPHYNLQQQQMQTQQIPLYHQLQTDPRLLQTYLHVQQSYDRSPPMQQSCPPTRAAQQNYPPPPPPPLVQQNYPPPLVQQSHRPPSPVQQSHRPPSPVQPNRLSQTPQHRLEHPRFKQLYQGQSAGSSEVFHHNTSATIPPHLTHQPWLLTPHAIQQQQPSERPVASQQLHIAPQLYQQQLQPPPHSQQQRSHQHQMQ